jgi:MerR family transcriptional regulator, copper efflux regulator
MQIGALAHLADVNIQTIRFYEREKLLRAPARTASGYRAYDDGDVQSVRFIRRAQELGFTLKEVRDLARIHDSMAHNHAADLDELVSIARERLHSIEEKLAALQTMKGQLAELIGQADGRKPLVCPASGSVVKR